MDPTVPPLPPGFQLDSASSATPPLPPGFQLDSAPSADQTAATAQTSRYAHHTGIQNDTGPGPTWGDVGSAVRQIPQGVNEGLTSILKGTLDAPAMAGRGVGNMLRGAMGQEPANVPLPSEAFQHTFVDPNPAPTTNAQSALNAGGRMAAENLPVLLGGAGLANSGVRSGVTLAEQAAGGLVPKIRGAADSVLDYLAEHPVSSAVAAETGATESGAGGHVGKQIAIDQGGGENAQSIAQLLGQLLTPTGAYAWSQYGLTPAAAKVGTYAAKKAIGMVPESLLPEGMAPAAPFAERQADKLAFANNEGKYTPNEGGDVVVPGPKEPGVFTRQMDVGTAGRQKAAKGFVANTMDAVLANPESKANLDEAAALQKEIPGFAPGIAKATDDPALKNLQGRLESTATNDDLRQVQQQTDASRGAIADYLASKFPQAAKAPPSPDFVGPMPATETPQDVVAKAAATRVNADTAKIGAQTTAAKSQIQGLSDSLPEADRIAQGTALRDSRDAAQRAMNEKTDTLRDQIAEPDKVVEVAPATKDTPAQTATIKQLLDQRASINQEMRDYTNATARTVDDVKRMRALQSQRDQIDAVVEKNADSVGGLRAYTEQYKTENVPQFRQGASAEVGQRDSLGYGGNRVDPEKVAGKFFNPNEESAAKQFDTAMGHDPAARQQMVDHALDDIRQKGTDATTGLIKPGFIDKWLLRNKRVLDQMPQTGPEIRAAVSSKDPDALYARMGELQQRQNAVADTALAKNLGKTPEAQIQGALNDWQYARSLKRSVAGDANGEAALARAVMDQAPDAMDPKFGAWVEGHKRALSELLSPEHLSNLQTVTKAAEIENRLPRPKGSTELPQSGIDKAGNTIGLPIKSLLQRFLAVAQGRVGAKYTAMDIGTRVVHAFTGREVDAVWREALSNPQMAQDLANVVRNQGATAPLRTRIWANLKQTGRLGVLHAPLATIPGEDAGNSPENAP